MQVWTSGIPRIAVRCHTSSPAEEPWFVYEREREKITDGLLVAETEIWESVEYAKLLQRGDNGGQR